MDRSSRWIFTIVIALHTLLAVFGPRPARAEGQQMTIPAAFDTDRTDL